MFYAVVRSVKHIQKVLLGQEFILLTDHAAFLNLMRWDLSRTISVKRWIYHLYLYTVIIEYQKSKDNIIADVFLRFSFASVKHWQSNIFRQIFQRRTFFWLKLLKTKLSASTY